jgi:hypothetical protein
MKKTTTFSLLLLLLAFTGIRCHKDVAVSAYGPMNRSDEQAIKIFTTGQLSELRIEGIRSEKTYLGCNGDFSVVWIVKAEKRSYAFKLSPGGKESWSVLHQNEPVYYRRYTGNKSLLSWSNLDLVAEGGNMTGNGTYTVSTAVSECPGGRFTLHVNDKRKPDVKGLYTTDLFDNKELTLDASGNTGRNGRDGDSGSSGSSFDQNCSPGQHGNHGHNGNNGENGKTFTVYAKMVSLPGLNRTVMAYQFYNEETGVSNYLCLNPANSKFTIDVRGGTGGNGGTGGTGGDGGCAYRNGEIVSRCDGGRGGDGGTGGSGGDGGTVRLFLDTGVPKGTSLYNLLNSGGYSGSGGVGGTGGRNGVERSGNRFSGYARQGRNGYPGMNGRNGDAPFREEKALADSLFRF